MADRTFKIVENVRHSLRLHTEYDPRIPRIAYRLSRVGVRFKHPNSVFRLEIFPSSVSRVTAGDLIRLYQILSEQSGDHRLCHHAAADKTQVYVFECLRHMSLFVK